MLAVTVPGSDSGRVMYSLNSIHPKLQEHVRKPRVQLVVGKRN